MVKDGDIFGDGVNIAARLESLATPGGVCISRGVRDHVRKIGRYTFEDLGEQTVKNIAHPIRAFRVRLSDSPGPAEDEAPVGLAAQEQPAAPVAAPSQNTPEFELAFWESIKDGEDPAEFAAYLEKYPGGAFAVLAETRLKALQEQEAAARREPQADDVELAYWDTVEGQR